MAWDEEEVNRRNKRILRRIQAAVIAIAAVAAGVYLTVTFAARPQNIEADNTENSGTETGPGTESTESGPEDLSQDLAQDPQYTVSDESGSEEMDVEKWITSMSSYEKEGIHMGIDVAKYQGIVDWQKVADAGVEFAMIRVGYRTQKTGVICEDTAAKYNLQEAAAAGLDIGVYFFSTAVNEEEAREEADWVCEYIAGYPITYPVAYNCEGFQNSENRQYGMSNEERTDMAAAFLDRVAENDYTPMFYAAKSELEGSQFWDTERLEAKYKVWVARYVEHTQDQPSRPDYAGIYDMWQYTNNGKVDGISTAVDINIAYFGYSEQAGAKKEQEQEKVELGLADLMDFVQTDDVVTAKELTNLRSEPSTRNSDTVVAQLKNGEQIRRTGMDEATGWSRLEYNGQTVYAVSRYLTTDLDYKPAAPSGQEGGSSAGTSSGSGGGSSSNQVTTQAGNTVTFTDTDDWVSPKIEVNLRGEPSTAAGNDTIHYTLKYGEKVHRTGIDEASGWSRVEHNGEVLYAVTSFIYVVEETAQE